MIVENKREEENHDKTLQIKVQHNQKMTQDQK